MDSAATDKILILLQNVNQMKAIISATFGSHLWRTVLEEDCAAAGSDAEELACEYRVMISESERAAAQGDVDLSLSVISNVRLLESPLLLRSLMSVQWLRRAQDVMSSMASNYDMPRLMAGQALAAAAVLCASFATLNIGGRDFRRLLPFTFVAVAYGVMMFASSYVEEEQHFWYWTTTAWLALLGLKSSNG